MNRQVGKGVHRAALCGAIAIGATLLTTIRGSDAQRQFRSDSDLAAGVRYRNLGGSGTGGAASVGASSPPAV